MPIAHITNKHTHAHIRVCVLVMALYCVYWLDCLPFLWYHQRFLLFGLIVRQLSKYVYAHMYVHMYVCVYTCTYVHTYMHIETISVSGGCAFADRRPPFLSIRFRSICVDIWRQTTGVSNCCQLTIAIRLEHTHAVLSITRQAHSNYITVLQILYYHILISHLNRPIPKKKSAHTLTRTLVQ